MKSFTIDYEISSAKAVALEDSIMQKGQYATAGSKILENYIPPFSATVVDRLLDNGYEIAGRTAMDEFGILKITDDETNSTPGAIKALMEGSATYSLCNDIFGNYRKHAAKNGYCYIHPTYGTVSRYGLAPLASSMDQIGVACKELNRGFELLSSIAGKDIKDGAMFPEKTYDYTKTNKDITLAIPEPIINKADEGTRESIRCLKEKFNTVDIELKYFELYKQVMYILSSAEISNNLSRYDGIRFGYRAPNYKDIDDLYIKTRSQGFDFDTKFTALMGSMVLSEGNYTLYYEKAMKIRRLIKESLTFDDYDAIVLPCEISSDPYENLALYSLAPLAGLPSISFSYMDNGIQLIAKAKNENSLLTAWEVCMT